MIRYNPTTGRWLSKDPIGISGGLNQYAFCGNNPVNFIDPFGLREGDPFYKRWWGGIKEFLQTFGDSFAGKGVRGKLRDIPITKFSLRW